MTDRQALGRLGEEYACKYLIDTGYEIIARNFHSRYGEVDIIAKNSKVLAFVEVKLRAKGAIVSGREAVTPSKMRKIIKTALVWMMQNPSAVPMRFDVMEITTEGAGSDVICKCEHIISAFDGEVCNELF